jgi:ferritin-like protein
MGHETWHEPYEDLRAETRDMHRALVSLMEELEAIDWYQQRADVTPDAELKAVIEHNRDEEIEHASMTLEWIRRRNPKFDANLRTYLFSEGPITEVEEAIKAMTADASGAATDREPGDADAGALGEGSALRAAPAGSSDGSLGVGRLGQAKGA